MYDIVILFVSILACSQPFIYFGLFDYIYISLLVSILLFLSIYLSTYLDLSVCIPLFLHYQLKYFYMLQLDNYVNIYIYIYTHTHTHLSCHSVSIFTCLYIYIYIYIYISCYSVCIYLVHNHLFTLDCLIISISAY